MLSFGHPQPRRRVSLTPMIDVVFLLLVFFMLSARFGLDQQLPLNVAGQGSEVWRGPPRLVQVGPTGVTLNGVQLAESALPDALAALVQNTSDTVVLRAASDTDLQRLVEVMQRLDAAGYGRLVLVE